MGMHSVFVLIEIREWVRFYGHWAKELILYEWVFGSCSVFGLLQLEFSYFFLYPLVDGSALLLPVQVLLQILISVIVIIANQSQQLLFFPLLFISLLAFTFAAIQFVSLFQLRVPVWSIRPPADGVLGQQVPLRIAALLALGHISIRVLFYVLVVHRVGSLTTVWRHAIGSWVIWVLLYVVVHLHHPFGLFYNSVQLHFWVPLSLLA